jgi:chemotaxis protein CheZ
MKNLSSSSAAIAEPDLVSELRTLAEAIAATRSGIAQLRTEDISRAHLPAAKDELDAVVVATEQATNRIFEAVEEIEALSAQMPDEIGTSVGAAVTAVYEACAFQDITGQRITKVVETLRFVDAKILDLLKALGFVPGEAPEPGDGTSAARIPDRAGRPDADLLNGPALPGAATSQEEIDSLLADLE